MGVGAAAGSPPEIIQGHYGLLSDIMCIYDIAIDIYIHTPWDSVPQDGFLQHFCLILSGPGAFDPEILQYFKGRVCTFLVSPVWILIGQKKQKEIF